MRCFFKALFVLKAVYFVACDYLDLLGLRKVGVGELATVLAITGTGNRDLSAPIIGHSLYNVTTFVES